MGQHVEYRVAKGDRMGNRGDREQLMMQTGQCKEREKKGKKNTGDFGRTAVVNKHEEMKYKVSSRFRRRTRNIILEEGKGIVEWHDNRLADPEARR